VQVGDQWHKPSTGKTYERQSDGTTEVWLDVSPSATIQSLDSEVVTNSQGFTAVGGTPEVFTMSNPYIPGAVEVYRNGYLLTADDYIATDGNAVSCNTNVGDYIYVVAFGIFQAADHYTKNEANALLADKADVAYVDTELADKQDIATLVGAIGNIGSPLLHADFKNGLNLIKGSGGINYSRATTATYMSMLDVLTPAGIDEPRFEKKGLRCSVGSTNLALNSDTLNHFTGFGITKTIESIVRAPDNTSDCSLLTSTSTNGIMFYDVDLSAPDGEIYTRSIFVKKGTSSTIIIKHGNRAPFYVSFNFDTEVCTGGEFEKLDNGWYRISGIGTTTNSAGLGFEIEIPISGETVYAYGVQAEKLPFATSYIPTTTTAVTRSADVLSIDSLNNMPNILDPITVSWVGEVIGTDRLYAPLLTSIDLELATSLTAPNDNSSYIYKAGEARTQNIQMPQGKFNFTATYDPSTTTLRMYHNGIMVAEDTTASTSNARNSLIVLISGVEGWIESVKIWDFVLSDTEIKLEAGIA
jgi:hypothetical protein